MASQAIPAIAASETPEDEDLDPGPGWSQERAEDDFLKRLAQEQSAEPQEVQSAANEVSTSPHRLPPFSSESTWRHVWMLYAAGILLFVSLSFSTLIGWLSTTVPISPKWPSLSPTRKSGPQSKRSSATPDTSARSPVPRSNNATKPSRNSGSN